MIEIQKVQTFFFRAMLQGWVTTSGVMSPDPNNPGFKRFEFKDGDLRLVDSYCTVRGSTNSAGSTTIWYKDTPVWIMHYSGFYTKRAIPVVKGALRLAYETGQFIGGRGVPTAVNPSIDGEAFYTNEPEYQMNRFKEFRGREYVKLPDGHAIGFHEYRGLWLPS